jgi:hypothetical protein
MFPKEKCELITVSGRMVTCNDKRPVGWTKFEFNSRLKRYITKNWISIPAFPIFGIELLVYTTEIMENYNSIDDKSKISLVLFPNTQVVFVFKHLLTEQD